VVANAFKLNGKVALVAGDSPFWSKYVAKALAEAGADVSIAGKDTKKVKAAVEVVESLGRKAAGFTVDMAKSSELDKMMTGVIAGFGKIDILVNATDLQFAKPFVDMTEEEWRKIMEVDMNSVFLSCKSVAKHMLAKKNGRIINIISCLSERGLSNCSAYCSAMGGVLQLTRALSLEWVKEGITVNAVGTGWFAETEKTGMPDEEQLLKYLPLKRYGNPDEIGSLLAYLASDAAAFYTGQLVYVDGGVMSHA
jgi:gluconate 5-dehydrogenase